MVLHMKMMDMVMTSTEIDGHSENGSEMSDHEEGNDDHNDQEKDHSEDENSKEHADGAEGEEKWA